MHILPKACGETRGYATNRVPCLVLWLVRHCCFRNEQEFSRFAPNDRPKKQIFPQKAFRVEVMFHRTKVLVFQLALLQKSQSWNQHVVLSDLQLEASGTYGCEVSAEAPSFMTRYEEKVRSWQSLRPCFQSQRLNSPSLARPVNYWESPISYLQVTKKLMIMYGNI